MNDKPTESEHRTKEAAIRAAKEAEAITQVRHWAVRIINGWLTTPHMPFLGEWYDAYGIRHG